MTLHQSLRREVGSMLLYAGPRRSKEEKPAYLGRAWRRVERQIEMRSTIFRVTRRCLRS